MGSLSKPKKPDAPKPIAPAATVMDTEPAADDAVKKQRRASGYQKTILAGALTPNTGLKTALG